MGHDGAIRVGMEGPWKGLCVCFGLRSALCLPLLSCLGKTTRRRYLAVTRRGLGKGSLPQILT